MALAARFGPGLGTWGTDSISCGKFALKMVMFSEISSAWDLKHVFWTLPEYLSFPSIEFPGRPEGIQASIVLENFQCWSYQASLFEAVDGGVDRRCQGVFFRNLMVSECVDNDTFGNGWNVVRTFEKTTKDELKSS